MATTDGSMETVTQAASGASGVTTSAQQDTPWEPPLAGSEEQALLGALDRLRATFRYKVDGLDTAGLTTTIGASTLTLGGLLKHLAANEDYYFTVKMAGAPMEPTWDENGWEGNDDWEFESAADDVPEDLYTLYDGAVSRARHRVSAALADGGLDRPIEASNDGGDHANLRRLVLDLVEEYGRHTGHADLLREAVDGRVGEDPPPGWQPQTGAWTWPIR